MNITAAQMNNVAALLGTTDKNVVISAVLKTLVQSGVDMQTAFDAVFSEGAYSKFAGEVYQALRAKGGK